MNLPVKESAHGSKTTWVFLWPEAGYCGWSQLQTTNNPKVILPHFGIHSTLYAVGTDSIFFDKLILESVCTSSTQAHWASEAGLGIQNIPYHWMPGNSHSSYFFCFLLFLFYIWSSWQTFSPEWPPHFTVASAVCQPSSFSPSSLTHDVLSVLLVVAILIDGCWYMTMVLTCFSWWLMILSIHYHFLELAQTHVHWVSDAIQLFHPLLSPSPSSLNPSQHQGLYQ